MEAIASLLQDDPYLRMTPEQRKAAVIERREKFYRPLHEVVHSIVEILPPISNAMIAEACELASRPERPRLIPGRVRTIQIAVLADYPGMSFTEFLSERRTATVVRARQVAMYLAKTLTIHSLPEIGRRFGNRDHTTVLHAVRKIGLLIKTDLDLKAQIDRLTLAVESTP